MTLPKDVAQAMHSLEHWAITDFDGECQHAQEWHVVSNHLLRRDAQIAGLERDNARLDASESQLIDERDRAQDALQKTHIELGGDGEWTCKMGAAAEPPPDSGDLHDDVPQLAAEVRARAELAESRLVAAERDTKRLDWVEDHAHALDWGNPREPVKRVIRGEDGAEFCGDTWREQIDAARQNCNSTGEDHGS